MSFVAIVDNLMENLALLRVKQQQVPDSIFANVEIHRLTKNCLVLAQHAKEMDKAERQGIRLPKHVLEDFHHRLRCIQDGNQDLDGYFKVKADEVPSRSSSSSREREILEGPTSRPLNHFPEQDDRNLRNGHAANEAAGRPRNGWSKSASSRSSPGSSLDSPYLRNKDAPISAASPVTSVSSVGSGEDGSGSCPWDIGGMRTPTRPSRCPVCRSHLNEPATPARSLSGSECYTPGSSIHTWDRMGLVTPPWSVTSPSGSSDSGFSQNFVSSASSIDSN